MRGAVGVVRIIEMCGASAWILRERDKRVRLRMTEEKKKKKLEKRKTA